MNGSSTERNERMVPRPVGTVAPDFTLPQSPLRALALRSLHAARVVLVFYPLDWEPVSREQLSLYQDYAHDFRHLDACVLSISVDHVYSHEAFARDTRIQFPLLADFQPRGATARRYGVYRERLGVSARALFVLDDSRVIRFSRAYPDPLNPGVDDVLTTLETLAQEQARMAGG